MIAPADSPPRLVIVAACAALLAIVLNLVVRAVITGGAVVPVAFLVAGFVAMWFAKSPARLLTKQERARFLWSYTAFLALPTALVMGVASVDKGLNLPALLIAAMYLLAYPATAQFFLSEKTFNVFLGKKIPVARQGDFWKMPKWLWIPMVTILVGLFFLALVNIGR